MRDENKMKAEKRRKKNRNKISAAEARINKIIRALKKKIDRPPSYLLTAMSLLLIQAACEASPKLN